MNNVFTSAPKSFNSEGNKDRDLNAFLRAAKHLNQISEHTLVLLSNRFAISSDALSLLIHIVSNGRGYYDN